MEWEKDEVEGKKRKDFGEEDGDAERGWREMKVWLERVEDGEIGERERGMWEKKDEWEENG